MNDTKDKIQSLLGSGPQSASWLASKIGISRQALHRHLKWLVQHKYIYKEGVASHTKYILSKVANKRMVFLSVQYCTEKLLPVYKSKYQRKIKSGLKAVLRSKKPHTDFSFLLSSSALYSSNIEGNSMNLNSFLNSRKLKYKSKPKEAIEIEDLMTAYTWVGSKTINEKNFLKAHRTLSRSFVAPSRSGAYRREPVGVFSGSGLEYLAVEPANLRNEMDLFFRQIKDLCASELTSVEIFFWASWIHLMIALLHPFSDGNGRIARLAEKWFLVNQIGKSAFSIQSEEYFWKNREKYYRALKLGANFWEVDFKKADKFFALLPRALKTL